MDEDPKEELLKLRSQQKLVENRVQAIINILSREGILSRQEVNDELERLVQGDDEK